jgi:hypothetical protein
MSSSEFNSPYISFSPPLTPLEDTNVQAWLNLNSPSIQVNLDEEFKKNNEKKSSSSSTNVNNEQSEALTRKRCGDCLYLYKSKRTFKQHLNRGVCAKRQTYKHQD